VFFLDSSNPCRFFIVYLYLYCQPHCRTWIQRHI